MTRTNRITAYETKQFLHQVFDIVEYNSFVVKELEKKTEFNTRRISYILFKACYYGYCTHIGERKYPFIYNGKTIYRCVNEYRINKSKYVENIIKND